MHSSLALQATRLPATRRHRACLVPLAIIAALHAWALPTPLRARPVSSPPPLVLVSQTSPPVYNSDGTIRADAAGNPETSPRLVDLEFANPLTHPTATTKVRVLLPANYPQGSSSYPVLYLLHGAKAGLGLAKGEQYEWWTRWANERNLFDFTADQDVVIVMPEGGARSFYSDWFNGGAWGAPMWETFHLAQLIPYIDTHYKVRTDRGGRVIAGVSMGGFGAMSYAARHPDLFAGAYAFSGALNNLAFVVTTPQVPSLVSEDIWGPAALQEVRWRGHNPVDLAGNLAPLTLWFRTATGASHESAGEKTPPNDTENPMELFMESRVLPLNDQFHQKLKELGLAHTYLIQRVGGHTGYHFVESLMLAWPSIKADFSRSVRDPAQFNYRTTEPRFRVWDWEFVIERDVVEFLTLSDVSSKGLTLQGSGLVTVKTPRIYLPNHTYSVTMLDASGEKISIGTVTSDANGRLDFKISLGEPHQFQQYTPEQKAAEVQDPAYWRKVRVLIST